MLKDEPPASSAKPIATRSIQNKVHAEAQVEATEDKYHERSIKKIQKIALLK